MRLEARGVVVVALPGRRSASLYCIKSGSHDDVRIRIEQRMHSEIASIQNVSYVYIPPSLVRNYSDLRSSSQLQVPLDYGLS
jgi:hypothetical protein